MKINKSSWHYRYNEWCGMKFNKANTLCSYFWKTVIKLFFHSVFTLLIVLCIAVLGHDIVEVVFAKLSLSLFSFSVINYIIGFFAMLLVVGLLCAGVFLILFIGVYLHLMYIERKEKRAALIKEHPELQKPENVAISFLKAKKSKICPMIEFVDDKHD